MPHRPPVILTSAERVLVHLHASWNAKEPSRAMTQAGIADGAHVLRSHVPRTLRTLLDEGLVESREARLLGSARRTTVYALTAAGVQRGRELLDALDATNVQVDGRTTSLGEARRMLGLSPIEAASAVDADGQLRGHAPPTEERALLQRDADLDFLRRWRAGAAPIAAVYGGRGMGKTAVGRAFVRTVPHAIWLELRPEGTMNDFAASVEAATGSLIDDPQDPEQVARGLLVAFETDTRLVVLDGYGEVAEEIVDTLGAIVRSATGRPGVKVLVLAQETTPAWCRFYGQAELRAGVVVERHLKGLDLEGCRAMLGNPDIREEDLRRIYLLTKGCPLYLQYIREGDEYGLRQNSRFTKAEVRLLLYSGRAPL